MRSRAVAYVTFGQVAFLAFIALCVALHPGFVLKRDEGGMSNYGIHLKTVIPYSLAFGVAGLASLRAASLLPGDASLGGLRRLLRLFGALVLMVLVSTYPYSIDAAWRDLHVVVGALLVLFAACAGIWLCTRVRPDRLQWVALVGELVGVWLAASTIVGVITVLFLAQMLVAVGFAIVLVRATRRLVLVS